MFDCETNKRRKRSIYGLPIVFGNGLVDKTFSTSLPKRLYVVNIYAVKNQRFSMFSVIWSLTYANIKCFPCTAYIYIAS